VIVRGRLWQDARRDGPDEHRERLAPVSGLLSLLSQLTARSPSVPAAPRPRTSANHAVITSPDLTGSTVVALHAHPDDEAIFTGITLRRLADAGARTVLVMATGGELGESRVPLRPGETVAQRRVAELERAAELLGVARLVLLGRRDSGRPGGPDSRHHRALALGDPHDLARRVARVAVEEGACAVLHDDEQGVYGHPDHLTAARIGTAVAERLDVPGYGFTVDREYLHLSGGGPHLVRGAAQWAEVAYGRVTAEIALAVTGDAEHLACKRAAITAHASQVDDADVPLDGFADTYGYEWYRRHGTPGVLESLGNAHLLAGAL
jgi:LmbE family N-acetylglucosaminyl deacetylase